MAKRITHPHYSARDFSAAERQALLTKGIRIIGATVNGYTLDDNGTQRIRTRLNVIALVRELDAAELRMVANGG